MRAEQLIDRYLEQKNKREPEATKFVKQIEKGVKVKSDRMLDIPFRDTANNIDQDNTWRSSSTAPY